VTIPEALAVEQIDGVLSEMSANGFNIRTIVVNNVVKETNHSVFLQERASQQQTYISHIYSKYSQLQIIEIPLFSREIMGIDRLRLIENSLFKNAGFGK
jgi:anion-transporting  ArsA/GET3 family ATPase